MAIGDLTEAAVDGDVDVYVLDTGMYDVATYGTVYIVDAERPAVVDTGIGTEVDRVREALAAVGIASGDLAVIALTHIHLDHAGGAGFLAADHPDAAVYVHEIGAPYLHDLDPLIEGTKRAVGEQWSYYAEPQPIAEDRLVTLEGGDRIDLGDVTLEVHHAPGHAPHQVIYHDPVADVVYAGDAAGIWNVETETVLPTTPPPNFDFEQAVEDVRLIADLDPATIAYGHFGTAPCGEKPASYVDALHDWVDEIATRYDRLGDHEAVIEAMVDATDAYDVWGDEKARYEIMVNVAGVLRYLDQQAVD